MANGSVTVFPLSRMQEIEDGTIVSGEIDENGYLILERHDGTFVNAGLAKGADGVSPEGGSVEALANKLVLRDASGRAYVATPVDDQHAVNLAYLKSSLKLVVQIFETDGTWTKPSGFVSARVRVQGGGGAGASSRNVVSSGTVAGGGGGGGGAYAESIIHDETMPSSVSVTVGLGGVPRTQDGDGIGDGGPGGESSFGTLVSAEGGAGGYDRWATSTAMTYPGGVGGNSGIGDLIVHGSAGSPVILMPPFGTGGDGGSSHLGGGGRSWGISSSSGQTQAGYVGDNYGGGGGGSITNEVGGTEIGGGAGAPGVVIVESWVLP